MFVLGDYSEKAPISRCKGPEISSMNLFLFIFLFCCDTRKKGSWLVSWLVDGWLLLGGMVGGLAGYIRANVVPRVRWPRLGLGSALCANLGSI